MSDHPSDRMFDLASELRELVDDTDKVHSAQFEEYTSYVVEADSEEEAEALLDADVDTADEIEKIESFFDIGCVVAFKIRDE